ncbi:NAD-dependent epimerase/dehydratase family protein [Hyphomonas sp.]|uniref:NAD-dependent epimerase/dehydratase family protein n=1 Tax=Hyphomonas sp. TaxID=87 RepID=UPI0034553438
MVTGRAGLIGAALVGHLLASGPEVVVVNKLTCTANLATLDAFRASPWFRFEPVMKPTDRVSSKTSGYCMYPLMKYSVRSSPRAF